MPAYLRDDDVVALKWVSGYPANKARGLPYITGLVVLNDADTGLPTCVMDGAEITAARTAAASGVCVRRFAPEGWSTAAILGAGEQGVFHAALLRELNPGVRIRAYDPNPERVERLGPGVEAAGGELEAVDGAEIVVTAAPIVEAAAAGDRARCARRALARASDRLRRARPARGRRGGRPLRRRRRGPVRLLPRAGALLPNGPSRPGASARRSAAADSPERVACVNLGIGALDAAFAARVLAAARERGAGTELPL